MHTWPRYIVFAFIGSVNIPEELNTPRCKLTFAVQVSSVAVCTTVIGGITMVNTSDTSRPLGGAISAAEPWPSFLYCSTVQNLQVGEYR